MFGLIDGNSFYCSCERAFDPKLRGKPLIVLSNNDGCAIARTAEVKALGVKMGDPWHLIKNKLGMGAVEWRSSNYELYGDMSRRMFQVLENLRGLPGAYALCREARLRVRRIAKIPTCVGIGHTKTIAKLANAIAKDQSNWGGVCDMSDLEVRKNIYAATPLDEVWGLGPASVEKAAKLGAFSIAEFVALPSEQVRKSMTVTGMRTQAELRGQQCLTMASAPPPRKELAVTRSFGRAVTSKAELREAVATYAEIAGKRLRAANLCAAGMQVFIETNEFASRDPQYNAHRTFGIETTSDTLALIGSALRATETLWREGYRYAKAGVVLLDLYKPRDLPDSLFPSRHPIRSAALMRAVDAITDRHGRGAVRVASTAPEGTWNMKRQKLSPRYTTAADEMLRVGA